MSVCVCSMRMCTPLSVCVCVCVCVCVSVIEGLCVPLYEYNCVSARTSVTVCKKRVCGVFVWCVWCVCVVCVVCLCGVCVCVPSKAR